MSKRKRLAVLFVFHEVHQRVHDFISNAIFFDDHVDFIIISNSIAIDVPPYVKMIVRANVGYDFGGWSEGIFTDEIYKKYDYYLFVNSSVSGPFLSSERKWTDAYIDGLDDNIKLFGSTINTCQDPIRRSHVQSYIFVMDRITLHYLINCELFSMKQMTMTLSETVEQKEIQMSRLILKNGWNIGSLLPLYHGVDFTFSSKGPHEYPMTFLDDVMYYHYRNILWTNEQLIFIKGNRV